MMIALTLHLELVANKMMAAFSLSVVAIWL